MRGTSITGHGVSLTSTGLLAATSGRVLPDTAAGALTTGSVTARATALTTATSLSTLGDVQLTTNHGNIAYQNESKRDFRVTIEA